MSPGTFYGSYRLVELGYRLWRYVPEPDDPLTYTTAGGRTIRIDAEFETDGATVPRFLWSIPGLDPMDWPRAAILHDWLWQLHIAGRPIAGFFDSNQILEEAIVALGWSRLLAQLVHWAVDLFGWPLWIHGEHIP